MDKTEEANSFYEAVAWLVETREGRDPRYKWLQLELDHIKLGLALMNDSQRAAFHEQFKESQIIKALAGDASAIEGNPDFEHSI